jgi:hypothetical protein
MTDQPVTWFDAPAGDRPRPDAYEPGAWVTEAPGASDQDDARQPSAPARRWLPRWLRGSRRR